MKFLFLLLVSFPVLSGTHYVDRPFPITNSMCVVEVSEPIAKPFCTKGIINTCYDTYFDGESVKITVNMMGFKTIKEVTLDRTVDVKGTVKSVRFTEIVFFGDRDSFLVVDSRESINAKLAKCGSKN